MTTLTCKNCSHPVDGNFCAACGQSAHTHEINLQFVVHEIQHGLLHVDRGFFYTLKELFTRPGRSIRDYINGKRVAHFKPVAFLLIIATVYAYLSHLFHDHSSMEDLILGFKSVPDSHDSSQSYRAFDWVLAHYAYTSLLLIPLSSLASYLAFIRSGYNYFQHLVLNAFQAGQLTAFHIVYLLFTYLVNRNQPSYTLDYIEIALGFGLTWWTYSQFFTTITGVQKLLLTVVSYLLFILFIMVSTILLFFLSKSFH